MKHLRYLRYVVRHKWFVFLACVQLATKYGMPLLVWRGMIHDWSKFLPSEWIAYANYFYGPNAATRKQTYLEKAAFDRAWLNHQHRNRHHWQHWVLREDSGDIKHIEMPRVYALEMIADWHGAGRAITGKLGGTPAWYDKNYNKILMHTETRFLVDRELQITPF